MKFLRILFILVFLNPIMAAAQDRIPILKSSLSSGSERLALYSFTEHLKNNQSLDALNAVTEQMRRQAFPIVGGQTITGVLSRQFKLTPLLNYDDNINGGNRNSSFDVGGFTLTGDPRFLAKEGFVLGAEVGGTLRYAYGRGRYLDISGGLSAVYSPRHKIPKYAAGVSVCSRNHIRGWSFIDFCGSGNVQKTDLDTTNFSAVSSTFTQLFTLGGFDHEASAGVQKSFYESYSQLTGKFELTTSLGKPGSINIGFEVGETVDNVHSLRNRVKVGYRTQFMDRPLSFEVSRGLFNGGTFFGTAREDEMFTASINTLINKNFYVGVSANKNKSTVDFYKYDSVSLNFGFTGINF